jgi:uncharacterized membrane protein (UPF0127 family)
MDKKIYFNIAGKKHIINVKELSFFGKALGLMFSSKERAKPLLFNFYDLSKESIHSLFVFYSFLAVWLDNTDSVVDVRIVKPWKFSIKPKEKFVKLIEIPFNKKYSELIDVIVEEFRKI